MELFERSCWSVEFEAKVLNNVTLPAGDRSELVAFQNKVNDLNRAVNGAVNSAP